MFGRAAITLGTGPHFSYLYTCCFSGLSCHATQRMFFENEHKALGTLLQNNYGRPM